MKQAFSIRAPHIFGIIFESTMAGNVPVDEAIRLVGVELSRRNQNAVLGT